MITGRMENVETCSAIGPFVEPQGLPIENNAIDFEFSFPGFNTSETTAFLTATSAFAIKVASEQ